MAKEPASIPKEPEVQESMDYAFLKRTGIDEIQEIAGDIWTDYNEHDPGVTILEQLCFAITELSYKTGMSVEELLYARRRERFEGKDNGFFTPDKAFPSAPISIVDYRRLLIDYLYPDVKNAWLEPLESGAFGVNMSGLYEVSLILNDYGRGNRQRVQQRAFQLLNANRSLCEDFERIRILLPLKLSIRGDIDVDPQFMVEGVMAEILYKVALAITPHVPFLSRQDLEERGHSVDEIFNGPRPKHGFVDLEALKYTGDRANWVSIHPARVVNIIRDVPGVDRVSNLEVGMHLAQHRLPEGFQLVEKFKGDDIHDGYYIGAKTAKMPRGHKAVKIRSPRRDLPIQMYAIRDEESVPRGFFPTLDVDAVLANNYISCTVEGLAYEPNYENVRKNLERLQSEELTQYQHPIAYPEHNPRPQRTAREISYYYSIQNQFPEIYGIGEYGVRKDRPLEWRTHARHLKAYLYFFEQIMANFLAQLTNFYKLFSLKDEVDRTYFNQFAEIPNAHLLLRPGQDEDDVVDALDNIGLEYDPITNRRNRSLDHMLARFGEEFLSEAYHAIMRNGIEENQQRYEQELIRAKLRFMRGVVELGRDRGRGPDYLSYDGGDNPADLVNHSTALQKRLALLFNMKDSQEVSMAGSIRNHEDVAFSKKAKAKGKKAAFTFSAKDQDVLTSVLNDGLSRQNFEIRENPKKEGEFQIFFKALSGKGSGGAVYSAESRDQCESAVTAFIRKVRDLNADSEGFHLVEHVLLRPVGSAMHTWFLVYEGRIFLETQVTEDMELDYEFRDALLNRGTEADNYLTTGSPEEGYTLVLTDEDGTIIAYRDGYLDETSAERERDRIIKLIPKLEDEKSGVIIRKEQHIPKGALLADDFYSLQITAILPAWPVRFRNDKFRALFEQMLKLSVPAHTSVNCFWLDLAEMGDFEKVYMDWRAEKAKLKPRQPWLDELSWCLVIMLKYFADPNDDLVVGELFGLRDKHGLSMKFVNEGE
ncbi:MAG: hypothetical protein AAGN35_12610 [Bacteroidota bacterium]